MERINNLPIRKTIVLYMAVSLTVSFFLSAVIVQSASYMQKRIWWKYVDEEQYFRALNSEDRNYTVNVPRPSANRMSRTDHGISEACDFLQTYTVLIMSIAGSFLAVYLFYRNKLETPICSLLKASERIRENDLDFTVDYENQDEMGQLCHEFERMRTQLVKNNQKLWENIEKERELRAAIAHDIRSPLSVLRGYQEMVLTLLPKGEIDTDKAEEMLKEGMKQIERMDTFIETMRKLSSLEKRQLLSWEITAEELERELRAELDILTAGGGKKVILNVTDTKEIFVGDKEVILEVAENLLSNALRYADESIEIEAAVTRSELRLCVRDDGCGFGEDTEEITKPFHKQNIRDSLKHAGLGMYISRLYCEKHGGRLLTENNERAGAVVTAVFSFLLK